MTSSHQSAADQALSVALKALYELPPLYGWITTQPRRPGSGLMVERDGELWLLNDRGLWEWSAWSEWRFPMSNANALTRIGEHVCATVDRAGDGTLKFLIAELDAAGEWQWRVGNSWREEALPAGTPDRYRVGRWIPTALRISADYFFAMPYVRGVPTEDAPAGALAKVLLHFYQDLEPAERLAELDIFCSVTSVSEVIQHMPRWLIAAHAARVRRVREAVARDLRMIAPSIWYGASPELRRRVSVVLGDRHGLTEDEVQWCLTEVFGLELHGVLTRPQLDIDQQQAAETALRLRTAWLAEVARLQALWEAQALARAAADRRTCAAFMKRAVHGEDLLGPFVRVPLGCPEESRVMTFTPEQWAQVLRDHPIVPPAAPSPAEWAQTVMPPRPLESWPDPALPRRAPVDDVSLQSVEVILGLMEAALDRLPGAERLNHRRQCVRGTLEPLNGDEKDLRPQNYALRCKDGSWTGLVPREPLTEAQLRVVQERFGAAVVERSVMPRAAQRAQAKQAFEQHFVAGRDRFGAYYRIQGHRAVTLSPEDFWYLAKLSAYDIDHFTARFTAVPMGLRANLTVHVERSRQLSRQRRGTGMVISGDRWDLRPSVQLRRHDATDEHGPFVQVPSPYAEIDRTSLTFSPAQLDRVLAAFTRVDSSVGGLVMEEVQNTLYGDVPGEGDVWHLNGDLHDFRPHNLRRVVDAAGLEDALE